MKITITKKMLMQAIAPMVNQIKQSYSPALQKYEDLKRLILDIEHNVNKPQVVNMLRGIVKGGKVENAARAQRVTQKLFQYLDSIQNDEKKMDALERKIGKFDTERKSDLENAEKLEYGDEDKDDEDEYVEREVEGRPVKEGKTFKRNDEHKKPDFSKERRARDKEKGKMEQGKTFKDNKDKQTKDYRKERERKAKAQGLKESARSKKNLTKPS